MNQTKNYDNSGILYKNKRKEKPNHADCTGTATIGGIKYWMDGYTHTGDNGEKYVTIRFKKKQVQNAEVARTEYGAA